ncbi:MAG: adenylate/guanylate cyclase domain-containing protein [Proteobacteria bacterium]|nr:adenylate/guanylate cyclase domain-containing protein [Pseudomonadota bacterium]MCP4919413.1 adenylate/guanylate cyclase domain-containing protein [Pseudomonadota bacterium]
MTPLPTRLGIVALLGALSVAGFLTVGGYVWLAVHELGLSDHVLRYFLVSFGISALIGAPLSWYLARPFDVVREDPSPQNVRDCLRLGPRVFALTIWLWLLPCLLFPILSHTIQPEFQEANVQFVVAGMTASFIVGVTAYYAVLRVIRSRVAPALVAGSLDTLEPFEHTRIWTHIAILLLLLGVISPATIATLVWTGHATPALVAYLAVDYGLVGLFVGLEVMAAVSGPIGVLQRHMEAVRTGELGGVAEITQLDTLGVLTSRYNSMVEGLRQREIIRETFGRYVTHQVAEEILSGRIELGGERRQATVLFADIRGFTELSEQLSPEEVVAFLNEYLGHMVECVLDNGGVLDKFIGDAIMALFGVPVTMGIQEDARAALRCANEMSDRLATMNADREARGLPPIQIGIGIHSGEVIAGNIGAPKRMEYTVVGDTVNVCSRIEGLTKRLGHQILLSDATARLVGPDTPLVELDTLPVKGRKRPVRLFTVDREAS